MSPLGSLNDVSAGIAPLKTGAGRTCPHPVASAGACRPRDHARSQSRLATPSGDQSWHRRRGGASRKQSRNAQSYK